MPLKKRYKYIAFFDLDQTILSVNSANYLVKESKSRGMMTTRQFRQAVFFSILYKLNWRDATKIIHKMLKWLDGLSRKDVELLCQEVFDSTLKNFIRPGILKELEYHRKNNGAVVLLSSATTFACFPLVHNLKMDDVICSHIEDNNGILTGRPIGNLVFGMEKKHSLLSYCIQEGYDPKESYYYGDAISDFHVMDVVGHPVCVEPDKKLKKIAVKRDWRIICSPDSK